MAPLDESHPLRFRLCHVPPRKISPVHQHCFSKTFEDLANSHHDPCVERDIAKQIRSF